MWRSVHEAFDLDQPIDFGIAVEVTDLLPPPRAREVYATTRGEAGRCALILTEDAELPFADFDAQERLRERLAAYQRGDERPVPEISTEPIERALARLADLTGGDPLRVLHRLDGETAAAIEDEADFELEDDLLLPDDPQAAYAELVGRAHAPGAGPSLVQAWPVRTHDVATAIAQLSTGRARVVRLTTTPARALNYLGFGGWNDCPAPPDQARIWERWHRTIGGAPVLLGRDSLVGLVARPVASRAALVQLAREVIAYDGDSLSEGTLPLLAMLYRNTTLRCWWD
jgi:Domain of unknown function (DUF4253)